MEKNKKTTKLHVKTGDTVMVMSGKDANKKDKTIGKVIEVSLKEGKVIVEGAHEVKKHVKPKKQGQAGGIITTNGAIYACKVLLYCSKCQTGRRTHSKVASDGEKSRVCVKCGEIL